MGLFDFLKSNKNFITDNGTNYIYHDNGKGSIKEKFSKINGVLKGEYFKYEESGEILSKDYYHDGQIITLDEKQRIDDKKRRIENNEKENTLIEFKKNISKLIEIDKLISVISDGNVIVQMNNKKLTDFSYEINRYTSNFFDVEFVIIYLFYKRNYLINYLIFVEKENISLNLKFTNYIVGVKKNIENDISQIGLIKPNIRISISNSQNQIIINNIILNLKRVNNNSYLITSLSPNSFNFLSESNNIIVQESKLLGLKVEGYLYINERIDKIKKDIYSWDLYKLFKMTSNGLFYFDKYTNYDDKKIKSFDQQIVEEIFLSSYEYTCNQELINVNFDNYNFQLKLSNSKKINFDAIEYYERGHNKYSNSDYEGAIIDFTKAIEIDGEYIDAYKDRAIAKWWMRDYEGAIIDYNKILDFNSEDIDAYESRGRAKTSLKDYKGAIEDFNKAIELDKESKVYSSRGRMKKNLLDYNGSLLDYNIAVEKYPEDESSYFGRGELKYIMADYLGAIIDFNKCIDIKPSRIIFIDKRADCRLKIEDYTGAIEDYSMSIQNRLDKYGIDGPQSENAIKLLASLYHNRGIARSKIKEKKEAIEDLKKALELDPDYEEAIQLLKSLK